MTQDATFNIHQVGAVMCNRLHRPPTARLGSLGLLPRPPGAGTPRSLLPASMASVRSQSDALKLCCTAQHSYLSHTRPAAAPARPPSRSLTHVDMADETAPAPAPASAAPALHACFPRAIDPAVLQAAMDEFVPRFKPMNVAYSNTNTYIKETAREAQQLDALYAGATEELSQGQQIEWRASSYMEVDEAMGGGMQKAIRPDLELLETCRPIIARCDELFKRWYRSLHGERSITDFKRLQTFVTRYRPRKHEDGLLRHIDGAQVDGSLILGLPSTFTGGGVTVWEGTRRVDEREWRYAMAPGDICCLDNFVYHQGNPISSGERWAFVIFYRCKRLDGTRWGRVLQQFGAETRAARTKATADADADAASATQCRGAAATTESLARFAASVASLNEDAIAEPGAAAATLRRLRAQAQALLEAHEGQEGTAPEAAAAAAEITEATPTLPAAGASAATAAPVTTAVTAAAATTLSTAETVAVVQRLAEDLLRAKGVGGELSHSRLVIFVLRRLAGEGVSKAAVRAPHIRQALANLVSAGLVERPTKERYIWVGGEGGAAAAAAAASEGGGGAQESGGAPAVAETASGASE